jgi:predicted ABC-class ATPase
MKITRGLTLITGATEYGKTYLAQALAQRANVPNDVIFESDGIEKIVKKKINESIKSYGIAIICHDEDQSNWDYGFLTPEFDIDIFRYE